jgi:cellulose synthase/poly-beta-1,6-N-acetylglucosamine synthase-like glycosyltransferase
MSLTADFFYAILAIAVLRLSAWIILSLSYNLRRSSPAPGFNPKISIIVPAYNEEKLITNTIQSLRNLNYPDYEIIIVDDGSTDRTLQEANSFAASGVKVLHQENSGKAKALNNGILASKGELVVTVDADTNLQREALRRIADRFAKHPRTGAVAGNVKVSPLPKLLNILQASEYTTRINLTRKAESMLGCVTVVPGPIAAFRREALNAAGLFSPDTFAEDFDMTMQVLKMGYRIEYEDRAIAYTDAPAGMEDLIKQRRRWYRGMVQVLGKHRDMYMRRRYGVAGVFGVPNLWFDVTSPVLNTALILLALLAGILAPTSLISLLGLAVYFSVESATSIFAIGLDPMPRAREFAAVPLLFFYNVYLDGVRMMALVEEITGVAMSWEKPRR